MLKQVCRPRKWAPPKTYLRIPLYVVTPTVFKFVHYISISHAPINRFHWEANGYGFTFGNCRRYLIMYTDTLKYSSHFRHSSTYIYTICPKLGWKVNAKVMWYVWMCTKHYTDVIMTTMASQITSLTAVYSIVYSDADQRKHQSSASLALCPGNSPGPVNSPHKGPVTRKMVPFDDVIMVCKFAKILTSFET